MNDNADPIQSTCKKCSFLKNPIIRHLEFSADAKRQYLMSSYCRMTASIILGKMWKEGG